MANIGAIILQFMLKYAIVSTQLMNNIILELSIIRYLWMRRRWFRKEILSIQKAIRSL